MKIFTISETTWYFLMDFWDCCQIFLRNILTTPSLKIGALAHQNHLQFTDPVSLRDSQHIPLFHFSDMLSNWYNFGLLEILEGLLQLLL